MELTPKDRRYDKQQDRNNDIRRYDNPNHMGHYGNQKRLKQAEDRLQEGLNEYYEGDNYTDLEP